MKKQRGVTLIELMIAVVVVGILTAIAVPAYTAHIVQGKIAGGTAALAESKVRMEQIFNSMRSYYADGTATCPDFKPLFTDTAFVVTVACTGTTFTVTATGGATKGMDGYIYSIDQSGDKQSKTPAVPSSVACWLKTRNQTSC